MPANRTGGAPLRQPGGLSETLGFADRPRGRSAFVGRTGLVARSPCLLPRLAAACWVVLAGCGCLKLAL